MTRADRRRGLALPWERRRGWLSAFARGSRWRVAVALAAVALAAWGLARTADRRHRLSLTRVAVDEVRRAVMEFRADVGRCPENAEELVHPPRTGTRYLREVPVDGWGRTLYFACPGRATDGRAEVVSAGPSGDFFDDDNVW